MRAAIFPPARSPKQPKIGLSHGVGDHRQDDLGRVTRRTLTNGTSGFIKEGHRLGGGRARGGEARRELFGQLQLQCPSSSLSTARPELLFLPPAPLPKPSKSNTFCNPRSASRSTPRSRPRPAPMTLPIPPPRPLHPKPLCLASRPSSLSPNRSGRTWFLRSFS